jgi:hypothetical protein
MYLTQLGIACFAVLVAGCHGSPVERAADDIRSVVSSDWRLTVSNAVIRIQSKRRYVKLVHRLSRNPMMSFEQLAKTYKPTNYQVTLTFVPRLSDAELKRLRDEPSTQVGA